MDCGRRFGKDILLQDLTIEGALHDRQPVGWAAPTYKLLLEDWKNLNNLLAPVIVRRSEQEKQISLLGGGVIDFWSLENADAIRGRKYARFSINEAGFCANLLDAWNNVVRPTLIDLKGDAYFSGTPKGQNGFWVLYNQTGDEWMRWQKTSYENPHIPKEELDQLKVNMPERSYRQEILAEFLEDGGGIFRNVQRSATAEIREAGIPGRQYAIGVDWGRSNDATVFSVVDCHDKSCVYVDRMTDTDFASQRIRLLSLAKRFNDAPCWVEMNSIGQAQLEDLQRIGVPVTGFLTTNASKAQIIDALALAFEQGAITIPDDQGLISELMAFQSHRLPSGLLRYEAPEGMHDDMVISLALAWWAGPGGNVWYAF